MIRDRWNSTTSRLALAAVCATGLVAAPLGFSGAVISSNSAAAQSDEGSGGSADIGADVGADLGGVSADAGADVDAGDSGASADVGADVDAGDNGASTDDSADADAGDGGASADDGADADAGDSGASADDDADADAGGGSASADVGADAGAGDGGASADAGADAEGNADAETGDGADAASAEPGGTAEQAGTGGNSVPGDAPAAETAAGPDPDLGRSGHPGVNPEAMRYRYFVSLDTGTPAFQQYKTAAERGDLEAAGDALAEATDRPVTLDLVDYVNAQLDVQTALTARQIAAAANDLPLASGGLRRGAPDGVTDAAAEDIIGDAVQR